ncbi:rhodanese-like domain-containing protein [Marivirga harenae]|uniref:rhodanese-like domain-containing protein n=1 Tax=Marivirga harenae TaxID=2010992 RepID=UPI0026DFED66|nr:rhodanese-like domain-containing protein [Marivirga harenae]WKV12109.1 rhodanese-like domain-containing protein [Marivirga harenae]|tara:strand:- start:221759 stop:222073 length:315 start_codon:yes stop_codon:yes gene_type:complete
MSFLRRLFGLGPAVDMKALVDEGAIIVDVRTKGEFQQGHIKNAMNIPVDSIGSNLSKLKNKDKTIITCCASGMRSGTAKNILKSKGYEKVYNGGAWTSLNRKIE